MLIGDDGKLTIIRKAEVLGSVSELTESDAKQKLVEKLDGKRKSGEVDTTVTLSNFVKTVVEAVYSADIQAINAEAGTACNRQLSCAEIW